MLVHLNVCCGKNSHLITLASGNFLGSSSIVLYINQRIVTCLFYCLITGTYIPSYFLQVLYFDRSVDVNLILILPAAIHRQISTLLECTDQYAQYSMSTE
jgi:hypothetical protein